MFSITLNFIISCESQILYAIFVHYENHQLHIFLSDSLCSHFYSNHLCCLNVLSVILSLCFCRTTFLMLKVSSSPARILSIFLFHIKNKHWHIIAFQDYFLSSHPNLHVSEVFLSVIQDSFPVCIFGFLFHIFRLLL